MNKKILHGLFQGNAREMVGRLGSMAAALGFREKAKQLKAVLKERKRM